VATVLTAMDNEVKAVLMALFQVGWIRNFAKYLTQIRDILAKFHGNFVFTYGIYRAASHTPSASGTSYILNN
jgi:hypothetical protein